MARKNADNPDSRPSRPRKGPARILGSLVGATAALPAATGVFVTAGLAGVPVGTAITRSVVTAAVVWVVAGLAVRLLFSLVIRNWQHAAGRAMHRDTAE